jgi:hypothetical protein
MKESPRTLRVVDFNKDHLILISQVTALILTLGLASARLNAADQRLFHTYFDSNRWWLKSPEGQPFFSVGVCVLDQGVPRHQYDERKPAYGGWRHYDSPTEWADASLRRLKGWKFSTIGGWSDFETLRGSREHSMYMTPVLHLGSTVGFPWLDMWDEKNLERMERLAAERIDPLRDDPRVIGYYSDNELGWWCATLWTMTLEQPATSG